MVPKIRNIIIFVIIAAVLVSVYIFFIKPQADQANLVSSPSATTLPNINDSGEGTNTSTPSFLYAKDFLALLLNVRNIKLNDAIFSDPAFNSLHGSNVVLDPDGNEGRPNPFAQLGNNAVSPPAGNSDITPLPPLSVIPSTTIKPPSTTIIPPNTTITTPKTTTPNPGPTIPPNPANSGAPKP